MSKRFIFVPLLMILVSVNFVFPSGLSPANNPRLQELHEEPEFSEFLPLSLANDTIEDEHIQSLYNELDLANASSRGNRQETSVKQIPQSSDSLSDHSRSSANRIDHSNDYYFGIQNASEDDLEYVREAISKKGARWIAGETPVSNLTLEERMRLCGSIFNAVPEEIERFTVPPGTIPFGTFDWRNKDGIDWMTSVKDQGGCGSCWAFGTLGSMEAMINIYENDPTADMDLSEQLLVSCCYECGDCGGGYPSTTYDYIHINGVPDESCFPYVGSDVPCNPCADYVDRAWFIGSDGDPGWIWVSNDAASIKGALEYYGPLGVAMLAPDDFLYYAGGIYEPVWSSREWAEAFPVGASNHWVTLVGYNDDEMYWIVKNSWGPGWGEDGYGRIAYGVLEPHDYFLAITSISGPITHEHDLRVSVEAPSYLEPSDDSMLNATVYNNGLNDETGVELYLMVDGVVVDSAIVPLLENGSSYMIDYLWTPTVEGWYNVTAYAPPVPDENLTGNNVATKWIAVTDILVYTDDYMLLPEERYSIVALDNLGLSYLHIADDPSGFAAALTSRSWSLVLVSHNNWYELGNYWNELEAYVLGGGRLVLSTFDVDGSDSVPTTLWSTLGAEWVSDITYPEAVYRWDPSHPIFCVPNEIGDLTLFSDEYYDDGDHVRATTGTPLAGFTLTPSENSASIVLGARTLLMSFILSEFRYDENSDGKLDAVQLWENIITYISIPLDHELSVSVQAPSFLEPGDSSLLNATVHNFGLNDETGVELYLMVDGVVVDSAIVPLLENGSSYMIDYLWTPTVEGWYNVTAYAPPVPDENITANNVRSRFSNVRYVDVVLFKNVDPWGYLANEDVLSLYGVGYVVLGSSDFGDVDLSAFSKVVIASDQDQSFYDAMDVYRWWFEDYVDSGGILEIHAADWGWNGGQWVGPLPGGLSWISYDDDYVTIADPAHQVVTVPNSITDVELDGWGWSVHGYFNTYPAHSQIVITEDFTGYPAYLEFSYGSGVIVASSQTLEWAYNSAYSLILENSLLYYPIRYPHDIAVSVEAPSYLEPGDDSMLNVTVYNNGLNDETGVELYLMVDGVVVDSAIVPLLENGSSYMIDYLWTPTVEGWYNVTAYAPPVPDENITANNIANKMVYVGYIDVALISDDSQLIAITPILDSMGLVYHLYTDNWVNLYTEDLSLLLDYSTVIFYQYNRLITSDEHSALLSYLSSGGNLLITGYDSLGNPSDPLLADVVRSSTTGDNVGESDLYVTDATHPVMNGPYGSFPAGYHISGLYDDCDMAEADTAQDAVTVAELGDGYDKIIATEGHPGKVVYWNGIGTDDWVLNSDCEAMFKNAMTWFMMQWEHDISITLKAPPFLEPGDSSLLNATVHNFGLNDETGVELYLMVDGVVVDSAIVPLLENGSSYMIDYLWTPTVEGWYNVTAYAPPVPDENITANNVISLDVIVSHAPKILAYVEYTDYDQEYANSLSAIDSTFGPNYILSELWDYNQLNTSLLGNDVLLIPEQESSSLSTMEMIGAGWSATLSNFIEEGGVIIVCDHYSGSYGILTGAGLMTISDVYGITGSTVYLVDPSDQLAEDVSDTFIAPNGAISFSTTETNVVFNDNTWPVVIHKTIGPGHIALIGFDYYSSNQDADQILGNAVNLWSRERWDIALTASIEGYSDVSKLGVRTEATEGFDPEYDEVDPPAPPSGVVSYFYYPDNPSSPVNLQKLSTSIIPPTPMPISWTYMVHPIGVSGLVTINWSASEIADIPGEYPVYLHCPDGSAIDMRTTTEYSFTGEDCTTYTFTITVGEVCFDLELFAGWNMISFPVIPQDPSFSTIFENLTFYQVLTWDGFSYIVPIVAEPGDGYWVLVLEPATVTVCGVPVESYELDLPAGWSMIGSIYPCTVNADLVFPSFYQLLTWDGSSYVPSTTIEPGKGYWAFVLEPTHIIVDGSSCLSALLRIDSTSLPQPETTSAATIIGDELYVVVCGLDETSLWHRKVGLAQTITPA